MDRPSRKLRFSLRTLMLLVAVAAVLSALFVWWTRKEYRYASFADAKASCDRNFAGGTGMVLIAMWGDRTGPFRRSHLASVFGPHARNAVSFTRDGIRHRVPFACRDQVVVESFENPLGNGLRLVYGKSKECLTGLSEHVE